MAGMHLGYNSRFGDVVIGPEADISFGRISGASTLAGKDASDSGTFTSTQTVSLDWLSTLRARVGYVPVPQVLTYVTGGLALGDVETSSTLAFNNGVTYSGTRSTTRVGTAVGAGAEYGFAPGWSLKTEYLHYDLGRQTVAGYRSSFVTHSQSDFSLSGDVLRLALDYHFGASPGSADDFDPSVRAFWHDFDYQVGTRYFWSTGTMLKSLKNPSGAAVNSRLTYSGLDANSGEAFGRVEHNTGAFVKGVIGAGSMGSGSLKDEDFPPAISTYSATDSSQQDGSLKYATADIGWDALAVADWQSWADRMLAVQKARLGPFIGYSYYREIANAFGCTQTGGNPSACAPTAIPNSVLGITQENRWTALRLGIAGDASFLDRFNVGAEVAWLPLGSFDGTDSHWLRIRTGSAGDFNGPTADTGRVSGFQAELTVRYRVTDALSLGAGGRYWYFRSHGTEHFEQSVIGGGVPQPIDIRSDRYGAFAEASLNF
jgi:opacity protein-like surface antigen